LKTKKTKNIYVSDLDGTLLQDNATLSAYTRKKLVELLNGGVNFTVASARSIVSLQQTLYQIPFHLPVIEINGAFISDFNTGKHLTINNMTKDMLGNIYSRILRHNCMPFLSAFNGKEDCLYYQQIINDGMKFYYDDRIANKDQRLRHAKNLPDTFKDFIVAFTVINSYDRLKPLAETIEADFSENLQTHFFENPYSPPWWWLTIHDKKACKSIAIKTLVEYTGFNMNDLVVFGDNLNDVNMFKMAARAIAVENASDEIKQYATEIIGLNEEDSVIKYIARDMNMA